MTIRFQVFLPLVLGFCSCAPQLVHGYDPVAHHTLRVTADTDTDVVWVQRTEPNSSTATLLRCSSTPAGPRCDQVKTP